MLCWFICPAPYGNRNGEELGKVAKVSAALLEQGFNAFAPAFYAASLKRYIQDNFR